MRVKLRVRKAEPLREEHVNDFRLDVVDAALCDHPGETHMDEAAAIVAGLLDSLPGGTVDALTVLLLDHARSQLVVRSPKAPDWPT